MESDKRVDDIVSMIDQFMADNGGHLNLSINNADNVDNNNDNLLQKTITITNSLECAEGDMACKVPTLYEGLDGK